MERKFICFFSYGKTNGMTSTMHSHSYRSAFQLRSKAGLRAATIRMAESRKEVMEIPRLNMPQSTVFNLVKRFQQVKVNLSTFLGERSAQRRYGLVFASFLSLHVQWHTVLGESDAGGSRVLSKQSNQMKISLLIYFKNIGRLTVFNRAEVLVLACSYIGPGCAEIILDHKDICFFTVFIYCIIGLGSQIVFAEM